MHNFMEILSSMQSFDIVQFTKEDIVRSTNMVREYIIQKDTLTIDPREMRIPIRFSA